MEIILPARAKKLINLLSSGTAGAIFKKGVRAVQIVSSGTGTSASTTKLASEYSRLLILLLAAELRQISAIL